MRRLAALVSVFGAILFFTLAATPAHAGKEAGKIEDATDVVKAMMAMPEEGIPPALLKDAKGIAVIPGVIKLGFVVGGRYGTGILMVRDAQQKWSNPVFVSLAGGSIGWQIGAQSTDIILVFKSQQSIDGIRKGKFTLGADAAVAAGPVGRNAQAATDLALKAEIFAYSRSRGLFAGLSLEGASLGIDDEANASYYGKSGIRAGEILSGAAGAQTPAIAELHKALK